MKLVLKTKFCKNTVSNNLISKKNIYVLIFYNTGKPFINQIYIIYMIVFIKIKFKKADKYRNRSVVQKLLSMSL